MRVFGLTGGIGAGKSAVAGMFRDAGIPVIDADALSRRVTSPGERAYDEIVRRFGRDILLPDGRIDRKKLGGIVFADPARRAELEGITHPRIIEEIRRTLRTLQREGHPVVIVEAALIHEKGRHGLIEAVIDVTCSREQQVERLVGRDGISREEALSRIAAQMDVEAKARASEHVIDNSGPLESTEDQVRALAGLLKSRGRR